MNRGGGAVVALFVAGSVAGWSCASVSAVLLGHFGRLAGSDDRARWAEQSLVVGEIAAGGQLAGSARMRSSAVM